MDTDLSLYELELIIEALTKAASRLESEARYYSRNALSEKADGMRKLKRKLERVTA